MRRAALDVAGDSGDRNTLTKAMNQLQAEDRESAWAVEAHSFMGLAFAEIAEVGGVSLGEVGQRWQRGIAWLKVRLENGNSEGENAKKRCHRAID